jgi:NADPH:quinone reductase-like Zn-dependent oxidoreductase
MWAVMRMARGSQPTLARCAGEGGHITGLHVGDEVFGIADGSFAQYASARPGKLAPKPANLTFAQAAAVPVSALTALHAVRDRGRVQAGQKVLVIGASGGVGTFAVQIAKAAGAEVTGSAGPWPRAGRSSSSGLSTACAGSAEATGSSAP